MSITIKLMKVFDGPIDTVATKPLLDLLFKACDEAKELGFGMTEAQFQVLCEGGSKSYDVLISTLRTLTDADHVVAYGNGVMISTRLRK